MKESVCESACRHPEPLAVFAGPREHERILLNLVLNARDAMAGGGLLAIETAVVTPSSADQLRGGWPGPYARLTVDDTGCGMTADVQARIFEPFFTTKEMGTGLGLSLVASTIQQLRGVISVKSEAGRGTSITVILPLSTGLTISGSQPAEDAIDSRD